MLLPANVEHPYAAEVMMNYLYDPVVAAKLAAWVNYISPVAGAKEELEKTDPEIANNELIFPPPEVQEKIYAYPALSPEDERTMQEAMAKVTGA
jgi:spermidine/putrescine transport system substrate-binding protein